MECRENSRSWKEVLSGVGLCIALVSGNPAFAAFTDDIGAGVDNTGFTYQAYQDGANSPFLVAGQGVGGGDAVRTGVITQSTASISTESGLYFDIVGPGTLSFQWSVDGQPIASGVGTLLQYFVSGQGSGSAFITGTVGFQPVQIVLPAGTSQFFVSYTRSAGSVSQGADAGWIDQLVWTPAGGSDTTPDAFIFNAQTGAPLSTVTESNAVVISGIDAAADISISSCSSTCEFSINGGGWTNAAGTAAVSNGDSVQVRQTSSASDAATTTLTLDIGGVTGSFDVTTESAPVPVLVGPTLTGTGTASAFVEATGNSEPGCNVSDAAFLSAPATPPPGVTLPHGLFGFTSTGCTAGFAVVVTIEYPTEIPDGALYWKYDGVQGWYSIPANIVGNTVTFTITDGGIGDSNPNAGTITDPGGIGVAGPLGTSNSIPTMSQWTLAALASVLALLAMFRLRRRTV